jgi:hypothetical protein
MLLHSVDDCVRVDFMASIIQKVLARTFSLATSQIENIQMSALLPRRPCPCVTFISIIHKFIRFHFINSHP